MAKHSTKSFMDSVGSGGGGQFSKWRDKGKTVGWIHPRIGIHERASHGVIPSKEEKDGKVEIRNRRFNCAGKGCPVCALMEFASKQISDGADKDELILDGGSKARYTLGEIAGHGDWRTNLEAKTEYILPWIPRDDRDDDKPVEILTVTEGLGYAIRRVIESQQENRGEKKGDPLRSPYAFKLIYRKSEVPMRKYDAEKVEDDLAPIDDDVNEIFGADESDLGLDFVSLTKEGEPAKMMKAIESCWDSRNITFEEFEEHAGIEVEEEGEEQEDGYDEMSRKELKAFIKEKELDIKVYKSMDDDDIREKIREEYEEEEEEEEEESEEEEETEEEEEEETKGKIKCPGCGEKVKVGKKYCPECGERLDKKKEKEKKKGKDKKKGKGKGKSNKKEVECDECEKMVKPTKYGKCPNCASRLDVPF